MHMDFFMLFLLTNAFRVVLSFHEVYMEYYFIDLDLNWTNAQQYCREHYTDLATISNMEDLGRVKTPSNATSGAWIGLFDDPASWQKVMGNDSNSWRWSATGTTSPGGYQKWYSYLPDYNGAKSSCVHISSGLWADAVCGHPLPFACFTGSPHQGSKTFKLVSTKMSWENARSYCRQHYTDLAMIEDETEFYTVAFLNLFTHVWIGLYREPWRWSDGNPSKFTNWAVDQPDNKKLKQHCVKIDSFQGWHDARCGYKIPFHCEKAMERKRTHVVKIKLQAVVDLSDPAMSTIKQIQAHLLKMGITDVDLMWRRQPRKLVSLDPCSSNCGACT